jgi:hypothetical protein
MTANNKDFKKQIQRVKDLISYYQTAQRGAVSRLKIIILSSLIKKCEDAATRNDTQVIDIYYKELKLAE